MDAQNILFPEMLEKSTLDNNREITQCIEDTLKHRKMVEIATTIVCQHLQERARNHDESKLHNPELEVFAEYGPKLKTSTYGSDEYKEFLKEMNIALDHHYKNNSHHPESKKDGIKGMSLIDIMEMFCDWYAATKRHDNGDLNKSIDINKRRFEMSDDLVEIFKNTVPMFNDSMAKRIEIQMTEANKYV